MIRIMGNSTERVPIKDLNDVIYFKQVKEFTDVELETSRDLKRELNSGRIIILEKNTAPRGSEDTKPHEPESSNGSSINIKDLKAVIREALQDRGTPNNGDIKEAVKELVPLMAGMIREEIAKLPAQQVVMGTAPVSTGATFQDLTYTPTVSSEGMISSIEARKTETSGDAAAEALAALRNLNKIKP